MSIVSLHLGDCRDLLRTIEPGSVDAVCSDPPYGIDYWHSGGGGPVAKRWTEGFVRQARKPISGDTEPFDPSHLLGWPCLLWGANHFAQLLPSGGSWLVWDKSCGVGPDDSFIDADLAWTSVAGIKRNVCRYLWKGVLTVNVGEENGRRYHPMQKPVGLMLWCFKRLGLKEGDTVFDPYMGSGTTGVAAVRAGLNFIGCEIEEGYFKTAEKRIEAERSKMSLFAGIEG